MSKKIIFDVGHPAQVHQFKNIYWKLKELGWEGLFTAKDKEVTLQLLDGYKIPYQVIGETQKGIKNKILFLPKSLYRFFSIVRKFKPDFILGRFSPHSCWIGKILNIPTIGFADTEHTKLLDKLTVPLVDYKLTPQSYQKDLKRNHIKFNANIELFYLHPAIFVPDKSIFKILGIDRSQDYVIIRFVSWDAHHDIGQNGFSVEEKRKLVLSLAKQIKVFVSSEGPLPEDLEPFKINIPIEKIHDVIYFAKLYIGEGATMASEAAMLGTPSIYVNTLTAGIIEEQEKFGLLYYFKTPAGVLERAVEMLSNATLKDKNVEKLNSFLHNKINVSDLVVWILQDYPKRMVELKNDPELQFKYLQSLKN